MSVNAPEAGSGIGTGTISVQDATALSLSVQFGFRTEEIAVALDMSAEEAGEALERVARAVA
jgi:hypothetical protein